MSESRLPRPAARVRRRVFLIAATLLIAGGCGSSTSAGDASTAEAAADIDTAEVAGAAESEPQQEPADPPATPLPTTAVPTTAVPTPVPAAAATPTSAQAEPAEAAMVQLPSVEVVNLVTGQSGDLSGLATSEATLVWFWAPH